MLLVNGADGIGTGWSTTLPNYNPRDIIANLKRYIHCEPLQRMCPWYRGFSGSILPSPDKNSFDFIGVVRRFGLTRLEVLELPIKRWTDDYREFLKGLVG